MVIIQTTDGLFIGKNVDETLNYFNLDGFNFEVMQREIIGEILILSNPNYIIYLQGT
jgi:hypothetical protein